MNKNFFQSKKAISTILGAALGILFVIFCHYDKALIELQGFALAVIGLFGVHVAATHLSESAEMKYGKPVSPVEVFQEPRKP